MGANLVIADEQSDVAAMKTAEEDGDSGLDGRRLLLVQHQASGAGGSPRAPAALPCAGTPAVGEGSRALGASAFCEQRPPANTSEIQY